MDDEKDQTILSKNMAIRIEGLDMISSNEE